MIFGKVSKTWFTTKLHKHHAPTIINDNGLELNDPNAIANAFNKFFSTIGTNLASKITNVHKSPMEYMINSSSDSFFLSHQPLLQKLKMKFLI